MENFTKALQVKGMMQQQQAQAQEMQMRQQQIQDQRAGSAAMREWDGQDMEELPNLYRKHGASAQAVFGIKSGILDYQTKLSTKSKTDLENDKARSDVIAGHIDTIKNMPPEQQPIAFEAAKADLVQRNYLDPKAAQNFSYQGPDQLDTLEKMYIGHSAATEDALKAADTREKASQAALNEVKLKLTQGSKPGDFDHAIDAITGTAPANQQLNIRTKALTNFALGRGDIESANQAIKQASEQVGGVEKAIATETNPQIQAGKVAVATAEGQARANIEAQQARGSNAALANVPPHLIAPATAEATKLGTEYATLRGQLDNLKSQLTAAKSGDEVASAFAPVATALGSNAFYGTHRLAPAEVNALGPGLGSVARQVNSWFDKHATGTLPPDSIKEFVALVDRLGDAALSKYTNGLKVANQNYGANFQLVQMGKQGGGGFWDQFPEHK